MKTTKIFILLLGLVLFIPGAFPQMSAEVEQSILKDVKSLISTTAKGINSLNMDTVFSCMDKNNFAGFINGGTIISNYDTAYSIFKKVYKGIKAQNYIANNEKYTVLSLNSALYTAAWKEDFIDSNDKKHSFQGTVTTVFLKTESKWKIIHVHQSVAPKTQTK